MKRRRLNDEDASLWAHVVKNVTPLPGRGFKPSDLATPTRPLAEPSSQHVGLSHKPRHAPPLSALDRRTRSALKRGTERVEAVLDLHGHRQDEAFDALRRFLVGAQRAGHRFVLVVTGKGGSEDVTGGRGVLKRVVPLWLRAADMRALVVSFDEATHRHGGSGALYVRVRRSRRQVGQLDSP